MTLKRQIGQCFNVSMLGAKVETKNMKQRSQFTRTGEPEPGVFGSLEPEPLEKKAGAEAAWNKSGAGAAKKYAGSSALRQDKKLKEIVF